MEYSRLGNTELEVSRLALGTVELGIDYGFRNSAHYQKPETAEAVRIIHCALDLGINLIDTARMYGSSEALIGRALKERTGAAPLIASKVAVPERSAADQGNAGLAVRESIEASLAALQIETIDVLQIHNTTVTVLGNEEALRALEDARSQGKVRYLGVSSDDEEASLAAMESGLFSSLQTPFNLLNRNLLSRVAPRAARRGVGILVRSAFLRGVLTNGISDTPPQLSDLKRAAMRIWNEFEGETGSLSELALRFCLSFPEVTSVVVGVRSASEIEANVADEARGRLTSSQLERVLGAVPPEASRLDPRKWQEWI